MDKVSQLKEQFSIFILEALREDSFKKAFNELLIEEFKNTIYIKRNELFQGESYRILRNSIKIYLYKNLKSQEFKDSLYSFIDSNLKAVEDSDRTIESLVTPSVINGIKVYVYNHKDELITSLREFLNSEHIDNKIQEQINSMLSGINPMAARFVSPSTILSKFKAGINSFLEDSKNIMQILNAINAQLDGFAKKKVSEFTAYFPAESRKALVNSVSKGILDNLLSESFIDMVLDKGEAVLLTVIYSLNEAENNNSNSFVEMLMTFTESIYDTILETDKAKELILHLSDSLVENLLIKPLIAFI